MTDELQFDPHFESPINSRQLNTNDLKRTRRRRYRFKVRYPQCAASAVPSFGGRVIGPRAERAVGEYSALALVTATIAQHEEKPSRGWLSPWIAETLHTPDLLQEAGYRYLLDWCMDDQPVWMKTRQGRILAVPYPQKLNDSAAIICRQVDAHAFSTMIIDQFDEMLEQSHSGPPLVLGIALYAMIAGQPFRLQALRRALQHIAAHQDECWLTTAEAVAAAFSSRSQV